MDEPQPLTGLASALGLGSHEHVAVVGGGGKTSVMFALSQQLTGSLVVTCTTKMGHDQHHGRPVLLSPTVEEVVEASSVSPVVVWRRIAGHKALGVPSEWCDQWFERVDHVVIEADGSRRKPFKAPAEHEPVVPSSVTTMVSVIGADALGRVIADQCHRPLRVAALAGCSPYERLSPAYAATVLLHERGARRELPDRARFVVVLNKVNADSALFVDELVAEIGDRSPSTVVVPMPFRPAAPE